MRRFLTLPLAVAALGLLTGCGDEWAGSEASAAGTAGAGAAAAVEADDDGAAEQEIERTLEELPAAVRETVLRESAGLTVQEAEEIRTAGGVHYEIEWLDGGNEVEIAVAPDGTLLGTEVEAADGETDDDGAVDDDASDDDEEDDD